MTDTDDREALATVLASAYNASPYRDAHLRGADAILASDVWRNRRPGPPAEAQVTEDITALIAELQLFDRFGPLTFREKKIVRAALGGVRDAGSSAEQRAWLEGRT